MLCERIETDEALSSEQDVLACARTGNNEARASCRYVAIAGHQQLTLIGRFRAPPNERQRGRPRLTRADRLGRTTRTSKVVGPWQRSPRAGWLVA